MLDTNNDAVFFESSWLLSLDQQYLPQQRACQSRGLWAVYPLTGCINLACRNSWPSCSLCSGAVCPLSCPVWQGFWFLSIHFFKEPQSPSRLIITVGMVLSVTIRSQEGYRYEISIGFLTPFNLLMYIQLYKILQCIQSVKIV